MPSDVAKTRWSVTVCRIAAVVIVTVVAVVYLTSLRAGRWPPSHPWSGFSLLANATMLWLIPAAPSRAPFGGFWYMLAALALTAALFWMAAAFVS